MVKDDYIKQGLPCWSEGYHNGLLNLPPFQRSQYWAVKCYGPLKGRLKFCEYLRGYQYGLAQRKHKGGA
jgi:hypothetical protein